MTTQTQTRAHAGRHPVGELTGADVIADLQLIIDGSATDVGGITASAEGQYREQGGCAARGVVLVRFADAFGHVRVAEVEMTATFLEGVCWHLRAAEGINGLECADCAAGLEPVSNRCGECGAGTVAGGIDHESGCSALDVPCAECGRVMSQPGVGAADPSSGGLCCECFEAATVEVE